MKNNLTLNIQHLTLKKSGDISFSNDDIGLLQFCAEADLPRSEGDYDHLGARSLFRGNDLAIRHRAVKTQIAAWIADQKLMLDMAVLLSIDVALTMLFCVHHVDLKTSEHVSRRKWVFFIFLKYFPGLLVFPVLFSVLVMTIFLLPGVSFQVVAWVLAVVLLVLIPVFTYGLRWLLPQRPIRLELLFLVEVLLGLMGIIGTVNGRTAVAGFNSFDALSLLGVIAIVIVGMAIGWGCYRIKMQRLSQKL